MAFKLPAMRMRQDSSSRIEPFELCTGYRWVKSARIAETEAFASIIWQQSGQACVIGTLGTRVHGGTSISIISVRKHGFLLAYSKAYANLQCLQVGHSPEPIPPTSYTVIIRESEVCT